MAGAAGLISARASSATGAAGGAAATGDTGALEAVATAGGGGGTIVGMEVSNSILSGSFRSDWMRIVCSTGVSLAACWVGAEGSPGQHQLARSNMTTSTLPTHKKYRATGTACTVLIISNSATINKCALKLWFQSTAAARMLLVNLLSDGPFR